MVVVVALIAVASMRPARSSTNRPEDPSSPVAARVPFPGTANDVTGVLPADMCPVVDFFGRRSEDTLERSSVVRALLDRAANQGYAIEALIALVPHPTRSHLAAMFDQHVQAIQRALEHAGYLLDRQSLPWSASSKATATSGPNSGKRSGLLRSPGASTGETCENDNGDVPGVILFRSEGAGAPKKLLLLLLVGESPTFGVDKAALVQALDLASALPPSEAGTVRSGTPAGSSETDGRVIRILGPTFSGSATSLGRGLVLWAGERSTAWPPNSVPSLNIISGSLTDADSGRSLQHLDGLPPELQNRVRFSTTVFTDQYVMDLFLHYLQNRDSFVPWTSCPASIEKARHDPVFLNNVAFLVENTTGYGLGLLESSEERPGASSPIEKDGYLKIPFPMHIAYLRAEWEKAAPQSGNSGSADLSPRIALDLPNEQIDSEDVIAPYSKLSSRIDDMVLTSVLSTITRRHITYVGLLATDVQDRLFLGRLVHEHCPDVTLFAIGSDLLYAHPQYAADLEGMLLASTYPLFTENQTWTYPHRGRQISFQFPSNEAEGVFNATLALLGKTELMVEYGIPLESPKLPPVSAPPVWISAVGRGSIWPVAAVCLREQRDPLLFPRPREKEDAFHPGEKTSSSSTFFKIYGVSFVLLCVFHALGYTFICRGWARWPMLWRAFNILQLSREPRRCFTQRLYLLASFLVLSTIFAWITVPAFLRFAIDWRVQSTWILFLELGVIAVGWVSLYGPIVHVAVMLARHAPARRTAPVLGITVIGSLIPLGLVIGTLVYAFGSPADLLAGNPVEPAWLITFYLRASNLASGLSPLLPMLFLGLALHLWSLSELRRLHLSDEGGQYSAVAELEGVGQTGLQALKGKIDRLLDDSLHNLLSCLGLVAAVSLLFWVSLKRLPPSVDGLYFVLLFEFLLFLVCVAVTFEFGRFVLVWRSLKAILRRLAWHPVRDALMRMPEVVSSEPLLDMKRAGPSLGTLKEMVARWERLAVAYRSWGDWGNVGVFSDSQRKSLETTVGPDLAEARAGLQTILDADAHRPWEMADGRRALLERVNQALKVVTESLVDARRSHVSILDAADDFLAIGLVGYIRYAFAHLRNLIVFATAAILLTLLAISSYPFQPKHLLLTLGWIAILSMVAVTIMVFVEMDRDEVLSWLTKTKPGHVGFNREFVSRLVTYGLVPVLGLAAAQFPEVGRFFFFWVEPVLKAFK